MRDATRLLAHGHSALDHRRSRSLRGADCRRPAYHLGRAATSSPLRDQAGGSLLASSPGSLLASVDAMSQRQPCRVAPLPGCRAHRLSTFVHRRVDTCTALVAPHGRRRVRGRPRDRLTRGEARRANRRAAGDFRWSPRRPATRMLRSAPGRYRGRSCRRRRTPDTRAHRTATRRSADQTPRCPGTLGAVSRRGGRRAGLADAHQRNGISSGPS